MARENNTIIDKYGYNADNKSRANKQGELVNEYYYALTKSEWKTFYNEITNNGYLATAIVGTVVPITINGKLIIAERLYTGKDAHDYVVIDAYELQETYDGGEIFTDFTEKMNERGIVYDTKTFNKILSRFIANTFSTGILAKYSRDDLRFVVSDSEGELTSHNEGNYRYSQKGIAGEGVSLRDKSSVQEDNELQKNSDRDTLGNTLTEAQQSYFAESKVRDENGNLKVMYHGTPNATFTKFRSGTYFTEHKWYADNYQNQGASSLSYKKTVDNSDTYAVYLDIKKPFDTRNKVERDIFYNEYYRQWGTGTDLMESGLPDWLDGQDLQEFLEENDYDYDGLILDEGATGGYGEEVTSRGLSYVVFNPEQVKSVENKNPTKDADYRFSDRYTETQYNNFGWVRYNDVLSAEEYSTLLSRYADYKHNKDNYPTTRFGEAVIFSFDHPDILMYVKGAIRSPQITKVVTIDSELPLITQGTIQKEILSNERKQLSFPYETVTDFFGEGCFSINKKRDFPSFQEYKRGRERELSGEDNSSNRNQQDGKRISNESETVNGIKRSDRDRFWYPNMSKSEIAYVRRIAKRELNTTDNYIDIGNKWLYKKTGDKTYFALYSTAHEDNPTVLYACKGNQAEFEHQFLSEYIIQEENTNGNTDSSTKTIDRILNFLENSSSKGDAHSRNTVGGKSNKGNAGVYSKNTRNRLSEAFLDCLRNIAETQKRNERNRLEQFSDRDNASVYDTMGETDRLIKENKQLKEDVERLNQRLKLERQITRGNHFNENQLNAVAAHIHFKINGKMY